MNRNHFIPLISVLLISIHPGAQNNDSARVLAKFEVDQFEINAGEVVNFTDKSEGAPTERFWLFERGYPENSNSTRPQVYYPRAGSFGVRFTVSDGTSSDTKIVQDFVKVRGLVHWIHFNGLLRDEMYSGTVIMSAGSLDYVRDKQSRLGRAIRLAPDTQISVQDHKGLLTDELSVAFWSKTTSNGDGKIVLIEKYDEEIDFGFRVVTNKGHVAFEGSDGSGLKRNSGYSNVAVDDNEWHHITGVMSNEGCWQIWVDGILESENKTAQRITALENKASLTLGYSNKSDLKPFRGCIDDVRVFNKAIKLSQISGLLSE